MDINDDFDCFLTEIIQILRRPVNRNSQLRLNVFCGAVEEFFQVKAGHCPISSQYAYFPC